MQFQITGSNTNYELILGNVALCFEWLTLAVELLIRHDVWGRSVHPGDELATVANSLLFRAP